jgi:hypothetical protein
VRVVCVVKSGGQRYGPGRAGCCSYKPSLCAETMAAPQAHVDHNILNNLNYKKKCVLYVGHGGVVYYLFHYGY